jgi:hypothetical protein
MLNVDVVREAQDERALRAGPAHMRHSDRAGETGEACDERPSLHGLSPYCGLSEVARVL